MPRQAGEERGKQALSSMLERLTQLLDSVKWDALQTKALQSIVEEFQELCSSSQTCQRGALSPLDPTDYQLSVMLLRVSVRLFLTLTRDKRLHGQRTQGADAALEAVYFLALLMTSVLTFARKCPGSKRKPRNVLPSTDLRLLGYPLVVMVEYGIAADADHVVTQLLALFEQVSAFLIDRLDFVPPQGFIRESPLSSPTLPHHALYTHCFSRLLNHIVKREHFFKSLHEGPSFCPPPSGKICGNTAVFNSVLSAFGCLFRRLSAQLRIKEEDPLPSQTGDLPLAAGMRKFFLSVFPGLLNQLTALVDEKHLLKLATPRGILNFLDVYQVLLIGALSPKRREPKTPSPFSCQFQSSKSGSSSLEGQNPLPSADLIREKLRLSLSIVVGEISGPLQLDPLAAETLSCQGQGGANLSLLQGLAEMCATILEEMCCLSSPFLSCLEPSKEDIFRKPLDDQCVSLFLDVITTAASRVELSSSPLLGKCTALLLESSETNSLFWERFRAILWAVDPVKISVSRASRRTAASLLAQLAAYLALLRNCSKNHHGFKGLLGSCFPLLLKCFQADATLIIHPLLDSKLVCLGAVEKWLETLPDPGILSSFILSHQARNKAGNQPTMLDQLLRSLPPEILGQIPEKSATSAPCDSRTSPRPMDYPPMGETYPLNVERYSVSVKDLFAQIDKSFIISCYGDPSLLSLISNVSVRFITAGLPLPEVLEIILQEMSRATVSACVESCTLMDNILEGRRSRGVHFGNNLSPPNHTAASRKHGEKTQINTRWFISLFNFLYCGFSAVSVSDFLGCPPASSSSESSSLSTVSMLIYEIVDTMLTPVEEGGLWPLEVASLFPSQPISGDPTKHSEQNPKPLRADSNPLTPEREFQLSSCEIQRNKEAEYCLYKCTLLRSLEAIVNFWDFANLEKPLFSGGSPVHLSPLGEENTDFSLLLKGSLQSFTVQLIRGMASKYSSVSVASLHLYSKLSRLSLTIGGAHTPGSSLERPAGYPLEVSSSVVEAMLFHFDAWLCSVRKRQQKRHLFSEIEECNALLICTAMAQPEYALTFSGIIVKLSNDHLFGADVGLADVIWVQKLLAVVSKKLACLFLAEAGKGFVTWLGKQSSTAQLEPALEKSVCREYLEGPHSTNVQKDSPPQADSVTSVAPSKGFSSYVRRFEAFKSVITKLVLHGRSYFASCSVEAQYLSHLVCFYALVASAMTRKLFLNTFNKVWPSYVQAFSKLETCSSTSDAIAFSVYEVISLSFLFCLLVGGPPLSSKFVDMIVPTVCAFLINDSPGLETDSSKRPTRVRLQVSLLETLHLSLCGLESFHIALPPGKQLLLIFHRFFFHNINRKLRLASLKLLSRLLDINLERTCLFLLAESALRAPKTSESVRIPDSLDNSHPLKELLSECHITPTEAVEILGTDLLDSVCSGYSDAADNKKDFGHKLNLLVLNQPSRSSQYSGVVDKAVRSCDGVRQQQQQLVVDITGAGAGHSCQRERSTRFEEAPVNYLTNCLLKGILAFWDIHTSSGKQCCCAYMKNRVCSRNLLFPLSPTMLEKLDSGHL